MSNERWVLVRCLLALIILTMLVSTGIEVARRAVCELSGRDIPPVMSVERLSDRISVTFTDQSISLDLDDLRQPGRVMDRLWTRAEDAVSGLVRRIQEMAHIRDELNWPSGRVPKKV